MTPRENARITKYPPLSEATKSRLHPYREQMGRRPDGEIASLAGVDRRYVVVYRTEQGIPPYDFRAAGLPRRGAPVRGSDQKRFRRSRLDAFREMMGEVSDSEVAQKAGASREAVMRYRQRHGIRPVTRKEPEKVVETLVRPAGPPSVPPLAADMPEALVRPDELDIASPADAELCGFLVTFEVGAERQEGLVIASDIVTAADASARLLARRDVRTRILSLRYCGPALGL